jgi:hypothetical protein
MSFLKGYGYLRTNSNLLPSSKRLHRLGGALVGQKPASVPSPKGWVRALVVSEVYLGS